MTNKDIEEAGIALVRARRLARERALAAREAARTRFTGVPVSYAEWYPKRKTTVNLTNRCSRACSGECEGCFGGEGGHHWIEIDRNEVLGAYKCRNCGAQAGYKSVWAEEIGRGGG